MSKSRAILKIRPRVETIRMQEAEDLNFQRHRGSRRWQLSECTPVRSLVAGVVAVLAMGAHIVAADSRNTTGKVVGITDGDTITVLVDRQPTKVRLAEIDTPERGQPWASRAKQALSEKVFGQVVELQVVDKDRYGRTVAKVLRDARDINREMVREGHAESRSLLQSPERNADDLVGGLERSQSCEPHREEGSS